MAISDVYTARNNNAGTNSPSVSTTTNALLSIVMGTTVRGWTVGVRVELGVTAAAAGNSVLFQLARPANTFSSTGGTAPSAHDFSAPAAIGLQYTAWTTTTPTLGVVLWEQELPQTTGSAWEEFPPLGYEWGIPAIASGSANAGVHMFSTASVGTSTPLFVDIIFSE